MVQPQFVMKMLVEEEDLQVLQPLAKVPLPLFALSLLFSPTFHTRIGGLCLFQTFIKLFSQVKLKLKCVIMGVIQVPFVIWKVLEGPIFQEIPLEHATFNFGITPNLQKC